MTPAGVGKQTEDGPRLATRLREVRLALAAKLGDAEAAEELERRAVAKRRAEKTAVEAVKKRERAAKAELVKAKKKERAAKAEIHDAKKREKDAKTAAHAARVEASERERAAVVEHAEVRQEEAEQRKDAKYEKKMDRRRSNSLSNVEEAAAALLQRPQGLPLDDYAERVVSQHGEDGITIEVLRRAGIEHRRAVEIGCGANGGNAGILVAGLGFEGLLLDGDEELVDIAGRLFKDYDVRVERAWITRESVKKLLHRAGFDHDLDYLGIDLDGVDYWIWDALDVRPRLMICEYNPFFGPEEAVTIQYSDDFARGARTDDDDFVHPKGYYGASITALDCLGRSRGYRLVGVAPASSNAYFLRDDVDCDLDTVSAADAWRPRTKGKEAEPRDEERHAAIEGEGVAAYFESRGSPLVEVGD